MSHRAAQAAAGAAVEPFSYGHAAQPPQALAGQTGPRAAQLVRGGTRRLSEAPAPPPEPAGPSPTAVAERDAFADGYAQGERAGIDLAARQLDAQRSRLVQTLEELAGLPERLTYRAERQVVELALAVAGRILHREIAADRELLLAMARVSLDRLSDRRSATVRLHPDDEAAVRAGRSDWPGGPIVVVADPSVKPGGCVVESEGGQVDLSVDGQLREVRTALLGDGSQPS